MNNSLNQYGVKDSINTYRNINGKQYIQWTDNCGDGSKEQALEVLEAHKKDFPKYTFLLKKIYPGKFYRIYKGV